VAVRGDQGAGDIYSDDFPNATLGGWWTAQQPSTSTVTIVGAGTAEALCRLTVPDNQDYDFADTPANVPCIIQDVTDGSDMDIQVWFKDWPDGTESNTSGFGFSLHQSTTTSNPIKTLFYANSTNLTPEFWAGGGYVDEGSPVSL
jgi:hypothetical protein